MRTGAAGSFDQPLHQAGSEPLAPSSNQDDGRSSHDGSDASMSSSEVDSDGDQDVEFGYRSQRYTPVGAGPQVLSKLQRSLKTPESCARRVRDLDGEVTLLAGRGTDTVERDAVVAGSSLLSPSPNTSRVLQVCTALYACFCSRSSCQSPLPLYA